MFAITFECTTALQRNHIFGPILQLIAPMMNKKYSQLSRCHAKYVIFEKRPYLKKKKAKAVHSLISLKGQIIRVHDLS